MLLSCVSNLINLFSRCSCSTFVCLAFKFIYLELKAIERTIHLVETERQSLCNLIDLSSIFNLFSFSQENREFFFEILVSVSAIILLNLQIARGQTSHPELVS